MAGGTAPAKRYADCIRESKESEKTGDEIAEEVICNAGLMIGGE